MTKKLELKNGSTIEFGPDSGPWGELGLSERPKGPDDWCIIYPWGSVRSVAKHREEQRLLREIDED